MRPHLGVITFDLSLPGTSSLKDKRSRLRPLIEGIRRKFHISISEVGLANIRDQARVSACAVSSDQRTLERLLSHLATAAENYDVRVDNIETEYL